MDTTDDDRPILFLYTPKANFVRPYFERMMSDMRISDSPSDASMAVMISSTDIYGEQSGTNINEFAPIDESSEYAVDEQQFFDLCQSSELKPIVLRCAPIIATGMTGWTRSLAERIYRGTFVTLPGNEARRSVVHAVSLPEAAKAAAASGGIYNVTDAVDPALNDLADALAWRISQKRVFSLKPRLYRFFFGKRNYQQATSSLTYSCEKLRSTGKYNPVSVVEYLKNHVYDDSSL